jgi:hypothetical protein
MKGTWTTDSSGSGGAGTVVLVIGAAVALAAIAGPVADAVGELLRAVVIAAAVVVALAVAGGTALVAYRVRQGRANPAVPVSPGRPVPPPRAQPLPAPPRAAIEAPREVHLHFHGVSAEDVAAIIRQSGEY